MEKVASSHNVRDAYKEVNHLTEHQDIAAKAEEKYDKNNDSQRAAKDNSKVSLADGYQTESGRPLTEADEREFIIKPDGSKDFGEISHTIELNTNGKVTASPIRLQVGNGGFGYIHIFKHLSQMGDKGHLNVISFINHTLTNFNQIYSQQSDEHPNRFVLYCKGDNSKGFMPIDLEFEHNNGNFYTIVSAMPHNSKIKGTLVYNGSATPSTATANSELLPDNGHKGGADSGSAANTKVLSTSNVAQKQEKVNTENSSIIGKQATVISDNGNEVKVHYKIVPADSLITSNSAKRGLAVNPAYPKELQPRDRQRVAMEQQVTEMSHNLRPEDLADSRNLNEGAPIVRSDKVVLNGNGRSISIIRALKGSPNSKVAKSYYKYLVSNAERLGFDRQAVLDMVIGKKEPILVREVDGNISDKAMQDIIGSTAGGSRMGASEQAKADAKKITADSLSRYVDNVTGDLTSAANRDFVSSLLYNITSKNDVNAYLDDKGHVNADGIQRVKRYFCTSRRSGNEWEDEQQ